MANVSKIEKHGLGKVVLELSLKHSIPEILTILKEKHGLKLGYKTVQRYIDSIRKERAEQTRAVINEYIKESIPTDLERLDKVIEGLNKRFDNTDTDRDAATLAGPLLKALDMKFDYSGAGKDDKGVTLSDEWRDVLRTRINGAASRSGEGANTK